jgi:hypothetical protein
LRYVEITDRNLNHKIVYQWCLGRELNIGELFFEVDFKTTHPTISSSSIFVSYRLSQTCKDVDML